MDTLHAESVARLPDVRTSACAQRFQVTVLELYRRSGVSRRETTLVDYARVLDEFLRFSGGKPPRALIRLDVLAWRDALLVRRQRHATVSRKLGIVRTLFNLAQEYELLTHNPATGVRVPPARGRKARVAWSVADLQRIFNGPIHSAGERPLGGGREAAYWLPLLALYTGARLEELAQLRREDVVAVPGFGHFLGITDEHSGNTLKNARSRRRIPVHEMLVRCGWLDYVARQCAGGWLFPDLKPNPRGRRGGYFSNFFSIYLRTRLGLRDPRTVFHSFRHTFKDACRAAGIEEAVHDALTGHTTPGAGRRYGDELYPLAPLFAAMQRVHIAGLDLGHLMHPQTSAAPGTNPGLRSESPLISAYHGIVVTFPAPAPLHAAPVLLARYGDTQAEMDIEHNRVVAGELPFRRRILVQAWIELHREELLANWHHGRRTGDYFRVEPLR